MSYPENVLDRLDTHRISGIRSRSITRHRNSTASRYSVSAVDADIHPAAAVLLRGWCCVNTQNPSASPGTALPYLYYCSRRPVSQHQLWYRWSIPCSGPGWAHWRYGASSHAYQVVGLPGNRGGSESAPAATQSLVVCLDDGIADTPAERQAGCTSRRKVI